MIGCLISWKYNKDPEAAIIAGLPIKQSYEELPKIDDEFEFITALTALYGNGIDVPQEKVSAKVIEIIPAVSKMFDYTIVMEKI